MSYGLFETEPRRINTQRGGGGIKIASMYEVLRMSDIIYHLPIVPENQLLKFSFKAIEKGYCT